MTGMNKVPVLIADDEPLMRQLLASILCSMGYANITHAADGPQALKAISEDGIAIAFLDIDMPGFTGLEVLEMAKNKRPDCFLVIVSAHSGLDNVLAALNSGARGFIVKPYNAQKIHDVLLKFSK
ncbi:MAG TPA: response regulator [Telluria sp.]|jgi:YesN/AraC family two-component response regulator